MQRPRRHATHAKKPGLSHVFVKCQWLYYVHDGSLRERELFLLSSYSQAGVENTVSRAEIRAELYSGHRSAITAAATRELAERLLRKTREQCGVIK